MSLNISTYKKLVSSMLEIGTQVAALSIARGTIFHSTIFEDIDHGKFFVVIGENESELVGFFFINSRINQFISNKEEMLNLQIPIAPESYGFLTHESYLNCASLTTIDKNKLASSIASGQTSIKGSLSRADINSVLEKVRSSKLYSKVERDSFFAE